MSTTTTTETAPPLPPLQLTLQNGQKVYYHSDISIETDEIPVIDISGIFSDDLAGRQAVAEDIREAAHRIGFFYITNHGIDPGYAQRTFEQAQRFFAQPEPAKMRVCTDLVDDYFGYFPMARYNRNGKKQKDLMEAYNWGYNPKYDPAVASEAEPVTAAVRLLWPDSLPGFKDTLYEHHAQLLTLARRLLRVFALALGVEEGFFDEYARRPAAGMRITHYPPQTASPTDQLGIGAHTDFECFTLVTQDAHSGLEVLSKSGYWIQAKPIPGSIVVNIADCFMRQTNDYFVSTVHRVVNKGGVERYSCPFFFGLDPEMKLEPVPTCVGEGRPRRYEVVSSGEYLRWRAGLAKKV